MDEKTYELTLLYDFYGELLTATQREYFELYYSDDLSLREIADLKGISPQGVRAVLVRCEALLREYEEKTGGVRRFRERRETVAALRETAGRLMELTDGEARALAEELFAGLGQLNGD